MLERGARACGIEHARHADAEAERVVVDKDVKVTHHDRVGGGGVGGDGVLWCDERAPKTQREAHHLANGALDVGETRIERAQHGQLGRRGERDPDLATPLSTRASERATPNTRTCRFMSCCRSPRVTSIQLRMPTMTAPEPRR